MGYCRALITIPSMQATNPGVEARGPWRRWPGTFGVVTAVAFALLVLAWALWADAHSTRQTAPNLGWTLLGLLIAFGLGWVGAATAARLRHAALMRDSRAEVQALAQLLDVWYWQTDADHRVVRWQPPSGAPAAAWAGGRSAGQTLWQRFDAESAQGLQAQMQANAPLHELDLLPAGGSGARWRLRGLPRLDSNGNFAGYAGTARSLEPEQALEAEHNALMLLLNSLSGPAFVFAGSAPDTLRHFNSAGHGLLSGEAQARAARGELSVAELLAGLPENLREAVSNAIAGQTARHEAWLVRCERASSGDGPMLLTLTPAKSSAAATAHTSADGNEAAADHEAFSYTVSHDLRAPIRVVEGFARILKEDYGSDLDRIGNDHIDRVLGAAARMNSMIDAMLALSHLSSQPLAWQPVNLSQLAGFVIDDLRREQPQRRVEVQVQPRMTTQGDPTLLRMALENLLGNAWKYTGKNDAGLIVFETVRHNGRDAYAVRDNGAGFDMRFADRLFGAFQRLHSANDFAGTGVGLASVQRIVRRHGGEVWAESEVGQGARFYFTLKG